LENQTLRPAQDPHEQLGRLEIQRGDISIETGKFTEPTRGIEK